MARLGTGQPPLARLPQVLPVDVLKIDRSFVSGFREDFEERELAPGIAGLTHALGAMVVAEGVENADQRNRL